MALETPEMDILGGNVGVKKKSGQKHTIFDFLGGSEKYFKKIRNFKNRKIEKSIPTASLLGELFFYSLNSHSSQVEMAIHMYNND